MVKRVFQFRNLNGELSDKKKEEEKEKQKF
jgi:hypothetical protein